MVEVGDNDKSGRDCSVETVRLQLGRFECECPYVQATDAFTPEYSYFVFAPSARAPDDGCVS
jgi:hypothetical protein